MRAKLCQGEKTCQADFSSTRYRCDEAVCLVTRPSVDACQRLKSREIVKSRAPLTASSTCRIIKATAALLKDGILWRLPQGGLPVVELCANPIPAFPLAGGGQDKHKEECTGTRAEKYREGWEGEAGERTLFYSFSWHNRISLGKRLRPFHRHLCPFR